MVDQNKVSYNFLGSLIETNKEGLVLPNQELILSYKNPIEFLDKLNITQSLPIETYGIGTPGNCLARPSMEDYSKGIIEDIFKNNRIPLEDGNGRKIQGLVGIVIELDKNNNNSLDYRVSGNILY